MNKIAPIEGWILDVIAGYDEEHPGFAGHFIRSSSERRQTIAAFFSSDRHHGANANVNGEFLASAKHNAILALAFQPIPSGFRRLLGKSGPQPYEPAYYTELHKMLVSSPSWQVNALLQSESIDPKRLKIIKSLPRDLCDIRIVSRIESLRQAQDLAATVEFFDQRTLKRHEIVNALIASKKSLSSVMRRWCRNIKYIDHPIQHCEGYRPILDGVELHAVARRYQNCSRNYTVATLIGENAFGEYSSGGANVLLCFEKHQGVWMLEGVYGRRNRNLKEEVETDARNFAESRGIRGRWDARRSEDGLDKALQRMIRPYTNW